MWNKYKNLKQQYTDELKVAEDLYKEKLARSLETERNSRPWWSTLKQLLGKGDDSSYPPLEQNNSFVTDNKEKADIFNTFFTGHSTLDTSGATLPDFDFVTNERLAEIVASEQEVRDQLQSLKTNKATGHDGIGPRMLKEAGMSIVPSLTSLINLSLSTSKVPLEWKKAQVIPIYKKNNASDPNNYRPVSILPTISKLAERKGFNTTNFEIGSVCQDAESC